MRVGLFDSGIGGLTVLKAFLKYHPDNEYFYYGDTLNVPYGDKTIDELYRCVEDIMNYMYAKNVDIIVIACGTVSANLYDRLKKESKVPIYSVLDYVFKYLKDNNLKNTLVLATSKTIESHIFKKMLDTNVYEVACPKLVPLIESNQISEIENVLDEYLKDIPIIDSLVLGCTHYPLIKDLIEKKIPYPISIIDMGEILAKEIELKDSFKKIDLYFSKKSEYLEKNVNNILK